MRPEHAACCGTRRQVEAQLVLCEEQRSPAVKQEYRIIRIWTRRNFQIVYVRTTAEQQIVYATRGMAY